MVLPAPPLCWSSPKENIRQIPVAQCPFAIGQGRRLGYRPHQFRQAELVQRNLDQFDAGPGHECGGDQNGRHCEEQMKDLLLMQQAQPRAVASAHAGEGARLARC